MSTAAIDHPGVNARRGVLAAAIALYITGFLGSSLGPAWVDEHPTAVLALSSRNRNLFGSVPFIDPLPYWVIGFVRIMVVGIVLYLVGRWYGQRSLTWMEGQVGELPSIYRWVQTGVDRAGWLLLIVMPGSNIVCLMAGHRKMRLPAFVTFLALGTAAKLAVLWIGGQIFEDQIRAFLRYISDYQWYVVGGLFLISFLQAANKARKSGPQIIDELEHPTGVEVEGAADTTAGPGGP